MSETCSFRNAYFSPQGAQKKCRSSSDAAFVECPLCESKVAAAAINEHIDGGCRPGGVATSTANSPVQCQSKDEMRKENMREDPQPTGSPAPRITAWPLRWVPGAERGPSTKRSQPRNGAAQKIGPPTSVAAAGGGEMGEAATLPAISTSGLSGHFVQLDFITEQEEEQLLVREPPVRRQYISRQAPV